MESQNNAYEVIVIGGGPAGVTACWSAGRMGAKTALIDKKERNLIGDKICGDGLILKYITGTLPKDAQDELLPRGTEIKDAIDECEVIGPLGGKVGVKLSGAPIVTVNRLLYGQRLLAQAERVGVKVYSSHSARSLIVKDGKAIGVKITNLKTGENFDLFGMVVIDASGATSAVRRNLPPGFAPFMDRDFKEDEAAVTFREIVELNSPHDHRNKIVIYYRDDIPFPGYWWDFSEGDKMINVGLGFPMSMDLSVRKLYSSTAKDLVSSKASAIDSRGMTLPGRPLEDSCVAPGFLIAGDAAFLTDAVSGEGHASAMLQGFWAGKVAADAIAKGDVSEKGLWEYNTKCMSTFGGARASHAVLGRFLENCSPKEVDFLMHIFDPKYLEGLWAGELYIRPELSASKRIALLWKAFRHRKLITWKYVFSLLRNARLSKKVIDHYDKYPSSPSGLADWASERRRLFSLAPPAVKHVSPSKTEGGPSKISPPLAAPPTPRAQS